MTTDEQFSREAPTTARQASKRPERLDPHVSCATKKEDEYLGGEWTDVEKAYADLLGRLGNHCWIEPCDDPTPPTEDDVYKWVLYLEERRHKANDQGARTTEEKSFTEGEKEWEQSWTCKQCNNEEGDFTICQVRTTDEVMGPPSQCPFALPTDFVKDQEVGNKGGEKESEEGKEKEGPNHYFIRKIYEEAVATGQIDGPEKSPEPTTEKDIEDEAEYFPGTCHTCHQKYHSVQNTILTPDAVTKLRELFEDLLDDYHGSEKIVINEGSTDIDGAMKDLEDTYFEYKKKLEELLGEPK